MKNVAFISQYPVFPTNSGNRQRILTLARAVRELGYDVTFFLVSESHKEYLKNPDDAKAHRDEFGRDNFIPIEHKKTSLEKYAQKLLFWRTRKFKSIFRPKDKYYTDVDIEYFSEYTKNIKKIDLQKNFDVVFVEYIFASRAFEGFSQRAIKILDTHDAFADRHVSYLHLKDPMAACWISVPPEQERNAFLRADAVIAIQDAEASNFRAQIGSDTPKVVTISHIITLPDQLADYEKSDAVFIGSESVANSHSINWFIENVLPLIIREFPDFRLHVIGSICRAISDHKNILKHNFIKEISDAYRIGSISINPTLVGTGINIKLLDAMACGSPTVATEFGVRGLPERFRKGVIALPQDDIEAFAREMLVLIKDADKRQREGLLAREAALDWNREQIGNLARILQHQG